MSRYDVKYNVKRARVLEQVERECYVQDEKWGEQNHPNGTGPLTELEDLPIDEMQRGYVVAADDMERWAKERCKYAASMGDCTYEHILTEEWAEAVAALDPALLRAELIQVAAVAVAWVEKIDRDAARQEALMQQLDSDEEPQGYQIFCGFAGLHGGHLLPSGTWCAGTPKTSNPPASEVDRG